MFFSRKLRESPNFPHIRASLDHIHGRRQTLIIGCIFGPLLLLFLPVLILVAQQPNGIAGALMTMMWMLVLLGFWAYLLYKWVQIYLHIDSYIFFQAKLDHPHVRGRGGTYYTVEFTDRHGNRLQRDTVDMFTSSAEPYLEDYNNQTVLIGYNEKTDRLVVIQKVNE